MNETITNQVIKKTKFTAFQYNQPETRIFYCNEIYFINIGIGRVFINDVFTLFPGFDVTLKAGFNEIDTTPYKITFESTEGSVQGWYKTNNGVWQILDNEVQALNAVPVSRRQFVKNYYLDKKARAEF